MTKNNTDVDSYIAGFPKEVQELLEQVRQTIRKAAPEAEEKIGYGIPTFTLHGNLVHFAAFKNHIGFYPAPQGLEAFKDDLSGYKGAKGTVQFPLDQPLPVDLITRITKYRIDQNLEKAKGIKKEPAGKNKLSEKDQVSGFIQKLNPQLGSIVQTIREIILCTDKEIGEQIKWNSPCFYYTGEMKPFDPREYKRDIVVMNLHKERIMLVFPTGARVSNTMGLLEGDYKDGRRTIIFKDLEDLHSKEKALQHVIKEWLKLVDK